MDVTTENQSAGTAAKGGDGAKPTLIDKLRLTPLPLFATVMGTGGLAMAWRRAHEVLNTPAFIADALFWIAAAVYVALLIAYGVRISSRERLLEDLRHPMKVTFLTAITVSLVILRRPAGRFCPRPSPRACGGSARSATSPACC